MKDWLAWHRGYEDPSSSLMRQADASLVTSFADAVPVEVLLLCGIFGNVSDRDIQRTVEAATALCRAGATVIWTRHRRPPDLTPRLRGWFAASGFEEIAFEALEVDALIGVGVGRLGSARGAPLPAGPLFTFGTDAGHALVSGAASGSGL